MNDAWKQFRNDFNKMSDKRIKIETECAERELDNAEAWLEAVASWEAAGKPRDKEPQQ